MNTDACSRLSDSTQQTQTFLYVCVVGFRGPTLFGQPGEKQFCNDKF